MGANNSTYKMYFGFLADDVITKKVNSRDPRNFVSKRLCNSISSGFNKSRIPFIMMPYTLLTQITDKGEEPAGPFVPSTVSATPHLADLF